ncbi:hypothetical protein JD79_00385 [Geodermatophilus normandii]|jgi:hypothetical protein|uniref:Ketohydroxyglutarate aldolase n=1 Tax=Geodermatophilus normandii TaxID=1137989 RepID=A0A317QEM0_9ACTN|nr:hypothetical protein [Geodermatophilus normandii]PWW21257.1 hypothetical protein JD79_00385 [Geodermatophilus normandii]
MGSPLSRFSVTVDDGHLAELDSVASALRDSGMEVERVLGALGVITGQAPADARPSLLAVPGVTSVDEQLRVSLPPPDASVQ